MRSLVELRTRSLGAPAAGVLRPDESLEAVWHYVGECLEALAARSDATWLDQNEAGLTQRLMTGMGKRSGERAFFFQKEFMENEINGKSPRADVAVQAREGEAFLVNGVRYADGERFLAFEAKRLPTPGSGREREYLAGQLGGVERFKRGLHAPNLKTIGLIAYVQRHSFAHWQDTLNGWVDELITTSRPELPWDEQDRLYAVVVSQRLARLRSSPLRAPDNARLDMHHFWVQLADPRSG